ncbi:MAG TPA: alcohol dehydrogenase catalytic domain-containing protein [Terriglobales bacterium]|nr:alcohol dehydrogenase catalytic domain-containing protein [Terriglobales bacterium]
MQALYFDGELSVREVPTPKPAPGEALIRMRLAGICGTDRQILKGYAGFRGIPGHEFVGEVVDCESSAWVGKRVVGEINVTCGHCDWCRRGLGRHCSSRVVMGIIQWPGTFAEFITLPIVNLHEVPANVADEVAVLTEPLAAACEILEQMPNARGTRTAVIGAGRLGLLIAQVLRQAGSDVTVIGRSAAKLDLARSWGLGVVQSEPGVTSNPKLAPKSLSLVIEATGSPQGLDLALRLVEPRGTVVMKSTFHQPARFDTAKLVVDEITLLGSRCGKFESALALLNAGSICTKGMISRIFPLEHGVEAFQYLETPGCLKVLLANR